MATGQENNFFATGSDLSYAKRTAISLSASGDLVAAVTNKRIRVISISFVIDSAATIKFQSGASTDLTGAMAFPANGGIADAFSPLGLFETVAGEKLNVVMGSSVNMEGYMTYVEIP